MNFIKNTKVIIAISFIVVVIILEIGKSIRINQLKRIEVTKIESMSKYEEKSKNDYLKPVIKKSNDQNQN